MSTQVSITTPTTKIQLPSSLPHTVITVHGPIRPTSAPTSWPEGTSSGTYQSGIMTIQTINPDPSVASSEGYTGGSGVPTITNSGSGSIFIPPTAPGIQITSTQVSSTSGSSATSVSVTASGSASSTSTSSSTSGSGSSTQTSVVPSGAAAPAPSSSASVSVSPTPTTSTNAAASFRVSPWKSLIVFQVVALISGLFA